MTVSPEATQTPPQTDLGILFIHGIGQQEQGQTLADWLDPIAAWVDYWLAGEKKTPGAQYSSKLDVGNLTGNRDRPNARLDISKNTEMASKRTETRTSITFAEAFWADCFPKPGWREVVSWMLKIAPFTLMFHAGQAVRNYWGSAKELGFPAGFTGLLRSARVLGAMIIAFLRLLVFIPLGIVLEAALLVLALLGPFPIPGYKAFLAWVQENLAAVIGDSFTFVSSPSRLGAITSQVAESYRWLSDRSKKVVVVAHSQGAAIAYHTFKTKRQEKFAGLVTFGSGLRKLDALRSISKDPSFDPASLTNCFAATLAASVGYLFAFHSNVLPLGVRDSVSPNFGIVFGVVAIIMLVILSLADWDESGGKRAIEQWRAQLEANDTKWLDMFASADPVSTGYLWPTQSERTQSIPVTNRCSTISDHTTYWENMDEFVTQVVRFASTAGELSLPLNNIKDLVVKKAAGHRRWRVRCLVFWRWVIYASAVRVLATGRVDVIGQFVATSISPLSVLLPADALSHLSSRWTGIVFVAFGVYVTQVITISIWRSWMKSATISFCSHGKYSVSDGFRELGMSLPSALATGCALEFVYQWGVYTWGLVLAAPILIAVMIEHLLGQTNKEPKKRDVQ